MDADKKRFMNILIGGEAGQGLVTVGQILAKGLVRSGYSICVTQDYQSRIRGGHNTFAIRVGVEAVNAPQESVDLLIALTAETVGLHRDQVSAHGLIVIDAALDIKGDGTLTVPFSQMAADQYTNIAALGVCSALLGLDEGVVAQTVVDFFGKAHPDVIEENRRVLNESHRWAVGEGVAFEKLSPLTRPPQRVMMNGNEAIALGAVTAGLKFCAFYPMTPATSIALNLAGWAHEMGLVVEQAEDEIAAINMALGASFAEHGGYIRRRLRPHDRGGEPGGHDRDPHGHRRGPALGTGHRAPHPYRAGRSGTGPACRPRRVPAGHLRTRVDRAVFRADTEGLAHSRSLSRADLYLDGPVSRRFLPGSGAF